MAGEFTRLEHDNFHKEFAERMVAENIRQNRRIELLEKNIDHINDLTISVEKMSVNMANMLEELKNQGERLEDLEKKPTETYNQVRQAIITTVIGTAVGFLATALITLL